MSDIFGVRVTADLDIIDSLIIICNDAGGQTEPSVTWAGQNYFVTYLDDVFDTRAGIIKVQRVSPQGVILDNGNTVGTGDYNPEIAYDGNRCLIVWSEEFQGVVGRFIDAGGQPEGPSFYIGMTQGVSTLPAIKFGSQYYLIAWADFCPTGTDQDIYGQLISVDGNLIGDRILIAEGAANQNSPSVTFDGSDFLVVWVENLNGICGRFLTENGMPVGSEFLISDNSAYERQYPSVEAGTEYFLTIWNEFHTDFDIYGNTDINVGIIENQVSTPVVGVPITSGQIKKYISKDVRLYDILGRNVSRDRISPGIYFFENELRELEKIIVIR
ncbi:MAG: hypothetical protein OEV79_09820 [candidate division WOR-3 bacterium]|nr:hypothetical protein [candidate division WOR-3 bacterium]